MGPLFALPDGPQPVEFPSDQNWGNTFLDVKDAAIDRAKSLFLFDAALDLAKKALEKADCYPTLPGGWWSVHRAGQVFLPLSINSTLLERLIEPNCASPGFPPVISPEAAVWESGVSRFRGRFLQNVMSSWNHPTRILPTYLGSIARVTATTHEPN